MKYVLFLFGYGLSALKKIRFCFFFYKGKKWRILGASVSYFRGNHGDDVIFLIRHLKLEKAEQVFSLIEEFYPKKQIPAKTRFFIEEVFEGDC